MMAHLLLKPARQAMAIISGLFDQPNYVGAKKMLDATVLRHGAIANNLANLETPNYKRLDVASTFSAQLQQAMASQDSAQVANLRPSLATDPNAKTSKLDGNTV